MYSLRKLQAIVLGNQLEPGQVHEQLQASYVPVTEADCRNCADPCDEGHENYPNRFDVDWESQMLGTVKPYRRQVVISTGKSDWDREITDTKGSLAAHLLSAQNQGNLPIAEPAPPRPPQPPLQHNGKLVRQTAGVFRSTDASRISILNASHVTMSDDDDLETVLVFPDYTAVADVTRSREGAQKLWESAVDPEVGRGGIRHEKSPFKTWVLPYSCVILLCSHKKRDNRCAIAAPKLEQGFIHSLQENGWVADTQLECQCLMGPSLEDLGGTPEETEQEITKQLKISSAEKRVLILKCSHVGGHKYAGNCLIYTPQGSCVWYGRVTPHDVESIVVNTIIDGLVLPPLLRSGMNLSRPGCKTLNDW